MDIKLMQMINKAFLITSLLGLVVGCASKDNQNQISISDLNDPSVTPIEKWSDAMTILEAMGVHGQRDVPKELLIDYGQIPSNRHSQPANADLAVSGVGYISPPTGLSSSASLGLGIGLFLLGGSASPAHDYQTAAWVPKELAKNPEEASRVVLETMNSARLKAFPLKRSKHSPLVGRYPVHHTKAYGSPANYLKGITARFVNQATVSPSFLTSDYSYGPIFLLKEQYTSDAVNNDIKPLDAMIETSRHLPDWFYIYYPGSKFTKPPIPARVINKGKSHYFISK